MSNVRTPIGVARLLSWAAQSTMNDPEEFLMEVHGVLEDAMMDQICEGDKDNPIRKRKTGYMVDFADDLIDALEIEIEKLPITQEGVK